MNLSAVINTFERPAALARCLAALAAGRGEDAPEEIVVVDDGGRADLTEALRAAQPLPVRLVRIEHAGRAAARNAGVAAARGERILFLGDDVCVEPGCVARHRACSDRWTAVVGPYPWRSLRGSPPFRRWAEPNPQQGIADPADAGFQYFATGNLSMDRTAFLELGGFDPRFTRYGWEDIDLGLRFELAGGRVVFDPRARATHEHGPMARRDLWRREYEMGQSAWQFWSKWAPTHPDHVAFMKFWDDPARLRPGPRWRRAIGTGLVAVLDRLAPASRLNERLYERLVFAWRLQGVADAWRRERAAEVHRA